MCVAPPPPGESERNPTPYVQAVQRLPSEDDIMETVVMWKNIVKTKMEGQSTKYTTSIPANCQDHQTQGKQETVTAKRSLRAQDKCSPWHPEQKKGH